MVVSLPMLVGPGSAGQGSCTRPGDSSVAIEAFFLFDSPKQEISEGERFFEQTMPGI
jgi:hypothetical protein